MEQRFGLGAARFGQDNGFGLVGRITDQSFSVKAIQCVPIVALPGPGDGELAGALGEAGQVEQRQDSLINLVEVELHGVGLTADERGGTRILIGHRDEQAKAEVGAVAEGERAANRVAEVDNKGTAGFTPAPTIAAMTAGLKLERTQTSRA